MTNSADGSGRHGRPSDAGETPSSCPRTDARSAESDGLRGKLAATNDRTLSLLLGAILGLAVASAPSVSYAALIEIDVGDYTANYWVDSTFTSGNQTLDLAPGVHRFTSRSGSVFAFEVDAVGTVISVSNPVAATPDGTALRVANVTVSLDPVAYAGRYLPSDAAGGYRTGASTMVVIPSLLNWISVTSIGGGRFGFRAAADGAVTSESPQSAVGVGNTLQFLNVSVAVDPQAFGGRYVISAYWPTFSSGAGSFVLVPGLKYSLTFTAIGGGSFVFEVEPDGTIGSTIERAPGAAEAVGSTLRLRNATVTFDPGSFQGNYQISAYSAEGYTPGIKTRVLVPDIRYWVSFGGVGGASFQVELDGAGSFVGASPLSADALGATLRFRTETIQVTPDATTSYYVGSWWLLSGPQTVHLVPNVLWQFWVPGSPDVRVAVSTPCAVDPPAFSVGGLGITLACGAPDSDGDGVPDDVDVCPSVPDPDQIDLDDDGLGDACDPDLDGDGFPNTTDVCPDVADDQTDTDGDGIGDPCDDDSDGDLVDDVDDNCPLTPNPDQANADGDLEGDACDPDDDDDGVPDEVDNCRLIHNADQLDTDGDGQGDACDGDDDGDGVLDGTDRCPDSPADLPIDGSGCTGLQRIELLCPQGSFVNHGQYVSCVAREANAARDEGLITNRERARIVSGAARSR